MAQNQKTHDKSPSQPFNHHISREKNQSNNYSNNIKNSRKRNNHVSNNVNTDDGTPITDNNSNQLSEKNVSSSKHHVRRRRKILVLHGDRQSGELLLGRMKSLKRKLLKARVYDDEKNGGSRRNNTKDKKSNLDGDNSFSMIELVALDAPFSWQSDALIHSDHDHTRQEGGEGDDLLRTWWHRDGDEYVGLDESLSMIHDQWITTNSSCLIGGNEEDNDSSEDGKFEGILGFSRGARLTHLIALLHQGSHGKLFIGLKYIIMASGYGDVPLPTNFPPKGGIWDECCLQDLPHTLSTAETNPTMPPPPPLSIPSLHIMGVKDRLIPLESSRSLLSFYSNPTVHEHDGGHHVPMRAADTRAILKFIDFIPSTSTDGLQQRRHLQPQPPIESRKQCFDNVSGKDGLSSIISSSAVSTTPATITQAIETSAEQSPLETNQNFNPIAQQKILPNSSKISLFPDEEHIQCHIDECESLALIFPEEFQLLSGIRNLNGGVTTDMHDGNDINEDERPNYIHPITYTIQLKPETSDEKSSLWPPKPIALRVEYPPTYPDEPPSITAQHTMNLLEFKVSQNRAFVNAVNSIVVAEQGMPCVMSCVFAARDFFESGGFVSAASTVGAIDGTVVEKDGLPVGRGGDCGKIDQSGVADALSLGRRNCKIDDKKITPGSLKACSVERIEQCKLEGMEIANHLVRRNSAAGNEGSNGCGTCNSSNGRDIISLATTVGGGNEDDVGKIGKGGSWKYTIGLVGKPSAGKSTFFNTASAFARQRGSSSGGGGDDDGRDSCGKEGGIAIGGATMAPHPFTTIDPNVGYCLVPAPAGSCPEDDDSEGALSGRIGCTHGRDAYGRRLLPVMLKDVAGLVPGAYQGRGKGNKFLDDLTDGDALIHVVDASGTADAEGNTVGIDKDDNTGAGSHPLKDLAWVHNELIQWVFMNLELKWDKIVKRGRKKLADMFSGYKQSQAFVWDVLLSVEKFLEKSEGRDKMLDHLDTWDEGDVYRLVLAFLGSRFPMALALNKSDLPPAKKYCAEVLNSLPLHGAHIGITMSARQEMSFVRHHIYSTLTTEVDIGLNEDGTSNKLAIPHGVWECLQSALKLRRPVLVFPVSDMTTYQPLPGMRTFAVGDSSLPNIGMIACLKAANGEAPTLWNNDRNMYTAAPGENETGALRDVLTMKPGSSVEDVFNALKWIGAIGGEFVRAEGASSINEKPKLVKKNDLVGRHNRILRIMTTKRREWQNGG